MKIIENLPCQKCGTFTMAIKESPADQDEYSTKSFEDSLRELLMRKVTHYKTFCTKCFWPLADQKKSSYSLTNPNDVFNPVDIVEGEI